jgi:hypothetical protein
MKKYFVFFVVTFISGIFFVIPNLALATSNESRFAGAASVSGDSGYAWNNSPNIFSDDNLYATSSIEKSNHSKILNATNFGFAIPLNATIDGIQVDIGRKSTDSSSILDKSVNLIFGDATLEDNKAGSLNWATTEYVVSYGSSSDLWNTTWTPAQINSLDFGVALSVKNNNTEHSRTASIDYIKAIVTYSISTSSVDPAETHTTTATIENNSNSRHHSRSGHRHPISASGEVLGVFTSVPNYQLQSQIINFDQRFLEILIQYLNLLKTYYKTL